ncbi:aromatic ring-hydroxylating oxygenase subunit alpha [Phenylobacterium montanum]|uniref:Aromatic ring-hydroxylating dioxygenase subunit alpha n=1 Tax=Phenylobacterium montanum TaxID=2823693 RepID=A0A975FZ86_9CAUL|nr:aromatic ring-hydroxylating dioxygenase subunit alpha [Caulobacter sp. S6]QUD87699.1 aromatic ring-hydroxylating dioxygenase subunit alpha [Caulobacter sp. S6]
MEALLDAPAIAQRILDHIDNQTTDVCDETWREPVANYRSEARFLIERDQVMRRVPTAFCPSAALDRPGAYIAREAAGTPLIAVRGGDGVVRAFRNACRHRGAQVACGHGREASFVCPYHGWTYGLDGALRHVPHEDGFPGLDKAKNGLVPLHAVAERGGIVFITQDAPAPGGPSLDGLPELLPPSLKLVSTGQQDSHANWKIVAEGFLEGYHIYATHRDTFFPVQFDNLNVVERFGWNSRVTFPYRNINKLRGVAPAERRVGGTLTHVYHLFPNVIVATFPQRTLLVVLEPISATLTRTLTYALAEEETIETAKDAIARDTDFVDAGAREDREVVESIQRGLASGANDHFQFGRFEGAITHFHRNLRALIEGMG